MGAPLTETRRAEVVVQLPPIEVWHALTRPEYLSYWIVDRAEVDLRIGGTYNLHSPPWLDMRGHIEKLVEGRRIVLRPSHRQDDERVEIDLIKEAAGETRVCVAQPEPELTEPLREALENLRSVWELGVDLREARRGILGVGVADIPPADRPVDGVSEGAGARINAVVPGGAAEQAGLRRGDIVVEAGGRPVGSASEFVRIIQASRPGSMLHIEIVREGERHVLEPVLGERVNRTQPPPSQSGLLDRLRASVAEADAALEEAVRGLGDADAYRPEAAGRWSVALVLAHLSVVERMTQAALDEAARGGRPALEGDSMTAGWRLGAVLTDRPPVAGLVARLLRDEAETIALLEGLPADVVAFKPRWMRVCHIALDYNTHSADHLAQIARIRKAIGA
jgi:uncharacterized protein YndB with AHSA1/START domain